MRSLPIGWSTLLAKLGLKRKPRKEAFGRNPLSRSLRLETLEDRRVLATLIVNTDTDALTFGNSVLTLREAVAVAQAGTTTGLGLSVAELAQINTSGGFTNNTINFHSSLNNYTIDLSLALGQISYSRSGTSLTIDASALNSLTIDANDPTPGRTGQGIRIFNFTDLSNGANPSLVTLASLTLSGSDTMQEGGAIRSEARLVIRDCVLVENEADTGGAIFVQVAGGGAGAREVLRIENSIIDDNDATVGGGIAVIAGSSGNVVNDKILISDTTISDNRAMGDNGGGIFAELFGADMTIDGESEFILNEAASGGGMHAILTNGASLSVFTTNFEENDATSGAGISSQLNAASVLRVEGCLIDGNEATNSGGGLNVSASNNSVGRKKGTFYFIDMSTLAA